jgi:cation diffusion facilitator CzcD-associated flavoprotein CzcO
MSDGARADAEPRVVDVAIIGAGFSGLYMLHRARDVLGLDAVAFEAGGGVGGTWYWNRYPGARCDSESYYYSFSFSSELEQEWVWSSKYPEQPEILRYLEHVADRFDLRRDIRFDTRVDQAIFDEANSTWGLRTDAGDRYSARFLVSAVGCLSAANVPDILGLDTFAGEWFHTGRWPHDGVDFTDRRVALIGTGSTGIQAAPVIACDAAHLTVFQRTPNYSVPARNAPLLPAALDEIKARYPAIRQHTRASYGGFPFDPSDRSALEVDAAERNAIYEALWQEGGFRFLFGSFYDVLINEDANETAAEFIRQKIRDTVHDGHTAELLAPKDYPYGAKRPPIDTGYFETFNRDNVTLVDLRATPIEEITSHGIRTSAGDHEVDAIVFATGFDAMTGALLKIDIRGRNGVSLREKWAEGPRTYLGLQISGFPNLFTITGPGSPSVLSNMPVSIEQHVEWICDCIEHLRVTKAVSIEATPAAEDGWVDHVAELAELTLFSKASSWYLGANIPGKKRVFMPYVGGVASYRQRCDEVAANRYEGFAISTVQTGAGCAPRTNRPGSSPVASPLA